MGVLQLLVAVHYLRYGGGGWAPAKTLGGSRTAIVVRLSVWDGDEMAESGKASFLVCGGAHLSSMEETLRWVSARAIHRRLGIDPRTGKWASSKRSSLLAL